MEETEDFKRIDNTMLPPRKPSGYEMMKKIDPNNPIIKKYDEEYREYFKNTVDAEDSIQEYRRKMNEPPVIVDYGRIDIYHLYEAFLAYYRHINGRSFDETANNGEGRIFARTMLFYLIGSKRFLESPLISNITEPSLDKGILVAGKWGNGKTTILRTLHEMFSRPLSNPLIIKNRDGLSYPLSFWKIVLRYHTANKVVDDYEWRNTTQKLEFWNKHETGFNIYDDVLTERQVSNYGKFEIFKDVFEKRHDRKLRSIVAVNYSTDENIKAETEIERTFIEIGSRYGNRVYDRMFSDFTVLELKGKSLRR